MVDHNVTLKIRDLDAQGNFLKREVDLEIRSYALNQRVLQRRVGISGEISLMGLRGSYRVTITPTADFEPQSQLVDLPKTGSVTLEFTFSKENAEKL